MHACFARLWPHVPQEQKEYLRGCITAKREDGDLAADAIHRAGLAARDKFLNERVRNEPAAQRTSVEPAAETRPAPNVRIRRL
jgi:hypothetical protein